MRNVARTLVVLGVLVAVGSLVVHAQDPQALRWKAQAIEQERAQAQAKALAAEKQALAEQILQLREQAVAERAPFDDAVFKAYWTDQLSRWPLESLEGLLAAGGEGDLNALTASVTQAAAVTPAALGDSGSDLVFTKVAPCRIVDTRLAGGAIPAGGGQAFYVVGTTGFPGQGGTGGGCGIPLGATAVALNLTVTEATGQGWLRASPYLGAVPTASVINYGPATWALANGLIQPICDPATTTCTFDLSIQADNAATQVIIDVTGYFMRVNKDQYTSSTVLSTTYATTAMPLSPGCANYHSVTINAPVAGRVSVWVHVQLVVSHTNGTADGPFFGVATTPTNCTFADGWTFLVQAASLPTDSYFPTDAVFMLYDNVTPGSHTYYLNGFKNSSNPVSFFYGDLLARFDPR